MTGAVASFLGVEDNSKQNLGSSFWVALIPIPGGKRQTFPPRRQAGELPELTRLHKWCLSHRGIRAIVLGEFGRLRGAWLELHFQRVDGRTVAPRNCSTNRVFLRHE